MLVLGIETSCDECAAAVVADGKKIISNIVASQIEFHRAFEGVVPEIASRKHIEWISTVVREALDTAAVHMSSLDGIAVTSKPGLVGSLLVGLSFAKGLSVSLDIPFVGVDHLLAHLYAPHLSRDVSYPYLGVIVSGGHTIIAVVQAYDDCRVLGTTIDDAIGEAFDKVAKHYHMGYPGGPVIEKLAMKGHDDAFRFPWPSLHKGPHTYDVSYSGLKTAAILQIDQFRSNDSPKSVENIAASFQKTAIDMMVDRVNKAVGATGLKRVVVGGGVAANRYLRETLSGKEEIEVFFPPIHLCTDNGAMVAGIGYHLLKSGNFSPLDLPAEPRVSRFRRSYP